MKRDLEALSAPFDVVVVGGGIYGACMAWEAVTRGLKVALLEKGDFGWSTSANMHRILHGGFRYLRNADIKRIRESVRERNTMMRLAPHLTAPLPFLVPTTRSGIQHREIMRIAVTMYDLLSFGRNDGIGETSRQIPSGRIISREECLRLAPGLDPSGVTGGAIWYDGLLSDPARLTLQFVRSADHAGASVCNYVEATGFLGEGSGEVRGVTARDVLSGATFDVRGRMVVNCTGPWINRTLTMLGGAAAERPTRYVRSVDVVTRPLTLENHGLALMAPQDGAPEQIIRYFIAPWRGLSVLGSVDYLTDVDPDSFRVHPAELEFLIGVARKSMPGAKITSDDVLAVQAGLIPHDDTPPLEDPYHAARHYRIVDHGRRHGVEGLISVTGIKYTTARDIAQKTLDHVMGRLGAPAAASRTAQLPLYGGPIDHLESFVRQAIQTHSARFDRRFVETMVRTFGGSYGEVLQLAGQDPRWAAPITPGAPVYAAQVAYAVASEMASKLSDVVLRRTNLATERHPGEEALEAVAALMGQLLGWSPARVASELSETRDYLGRFWVRSSVGAAPAREPAGDAIEARTA